MKFRDDICAYLLSAGDLAIMRTSKQIHHEARECLYREGAYRINIGLSIDSDGNPCPWKEWKSCQNLHFRIFFGPGSTLARRLPAFRPRFWQFGLFDETYGTDRKRKCLVTIEYETYDPWAPFRAYLFSVEDLLEQMSHLTSFTTVVVMFAPKQDLQWNNKEMCDLLDRELPVDKWGVLKERLEPDLGPAKLVGDTDGEDQRLVGLPPSRFSRPAGAKAA